MRIAMALYADVSHDSRVLREATTLADAGHDVTIVCIAGAAPEGSPFRVIAGHPDRGGVLPDGSSPFLRDRRRVQGQARRATRRLAEGLRQLDPGLGPLGGRIGRTGGRLARPRPHRPRRRRAPGPAADAARLRQPRDLPRDRHGGAAARFRPPRAPAPGAPLGRPGRCARDGQRGIRRGPRAPDQAPPDRHRPELPAAPRDRRRVGDGPDERQDPRRRRDPGRCAGRALPRRVRPPPRDRATALAMLEPGMERHHLAILGFGSIRRRARGDWPRSRASAVASTSSRPSRPTTSSTGSGRPMST